MVLSIPSCSSRAVTTTVSGGGPPGAGEAPREPPRTSARTETRRTAPKSSAPSRSHPTAAAAPAPRIAAVSRLDLGRGGLRLARVGELLDGGVEGAVRARQENVAGVHLAAVRMDGDRRLVGRVLDRVVVHGRDERAGLADTGLDDLVAMEPRDVVLDRSVQVVAGHADVAPVHAFDAPHPAVIVDRRPLAGAPHHDDDREALRGIDVKQVARVAVGLRDEASLRYPAWSREEGRHQILHRGHHLRLATA